MSEAFGITGLLGLIAFIIAIIVAAIRKTPKKEYVKYVIGMAICFVLFIIGVSLPDDNAVQTSAQSSTSSTLQNANSAKDVLSSHASPDILKVDYKKLYKDYEENPINADKIYRDKKVQITGTISSISRDIGQNPYITFNVDEYGAKSIKMAFDSDDPVASMKKGQKITITGNCKGMFANVLVELYDCTK